jgi:hypothetical protein
MDVCVCVALLPSIPLSFSLSLSHTHTHTHTDGETVGSRIDEVNPKQGNQTILNYALATLYPPRVYEVLELDTQKCLLRKKSRVVIGTYNKNTHPHTHLHTHI